MICLKISTFVVLTTTINETIVQPISCDLLKNIYLCGINNNRIDSMVNRWLVVICLKISIFVVSTTTVFHCPPNRPRCDLLENIYLCGINNNSVALFSSFTPVVICLKISIFVASTTTAITLRQ